MLSVLVLVALAQAAPATAPTAFDASRAAASAPRPVLDIDTGKLKGDPVLLVVADDGRVFVRTAEVDRFGNERGKNYVAAASSEPFAQVDDLPDWVSSYWAWKSGVVAPGVPSLKFEIEQSDAGKLASGSTSQASGVDNPNRSDPSSNQIAHDMASYQKVVTTVVRLKGHVVFEGQNAPFKPGLTFGWAPPPLGAVVFSDARRRLALVDREGRRKDLAGTADALLPGWTSDGQHVFYLQKRGRKQYSLMMVDIR
jgi:hypothetical protein